MVSALKAALNGAAFCFLPAKSEIQAFLFKERYSGVLQILNPSSPPLNIREICRRGQEILADIYSKMQAPSTFSQYNMALYYSKLPAVFDRKTAIAIGKARYLAPRTSDKYLSILTDVYHKLERVSPGEYRKVG